MSISDESKEKAIFHLENAIECLKKGFGEDAEINAEEAKTILPKDTKFSDLTEGKDYIDLEQREKSLTLEKRAEIATERGELGFNHADCVACGRAIGHSENSEWIHLDGIPCADAPWLGDGTLEATEEDFTEAYLNHREIVNHEGRIKPGTETYSGIQMFPIHSISQKYMEKLNMSSESQTEKEVQEDNFLAKHGMKKGDEIDPRAGVGKECLYCESERWECEPTDQNGGRVWFCEDCDFEIHLRTAHIIVGVSILPTEVRPTEHDWEIFTRTDREDDDRKQANACMPKVERPPKPIQAKR